MSQSPPSPADDLQFDTVEAAGTPQSAAEVPAAPMTCAACKQPIADVYFALGKHTLCPTCCRETVAAQSGSDVGRLVTAGIFGLGAGLVGALIWFLVRKYTHYEIGLISVLVGYMVARAMRKGSGGKGGRPYQVIAVVVTYLCIAANYAPDTYQRVVDQAADMGDTLPTGQIVMQTAVRALREPIDNGMSNIIGAIIIGFGLYQAWIMTRSLRLPISGPHPIGQVAPPAEGAPQ